MNATTCIQFGAAPPFWRRIWLITFTPLLVAAIAPVALAEEAVFVVLRHVERENAAALRQAIEAESQRYFLRSPLNLRWLERAAQIEDRPGTLVLVTLRGNCDITTRAGTVETSRPMGEVLATDGHVMPYIFLDCDRIRLALDRVREERCMPESWELLARALVRVFEHELMHVLTGSGEHLAHGIGAAAIPAEILADPFRESSLFAARGTEESPAQEVTICIRRGLI